MKKKGIIISLIGIVIVSTGLIIIVNQNTKKVIMQDGAMLALTLDGNSITEFPSSTNYRVEIDCENGRGKVLPEDGTWKFSVDNIEGNVKCYIDFYSRTENDKLVNKVESLADSTQGEGKLVHEEITEYKSTFTTEGAIEQANYMNLNNDTTYPWTWNNTDKTWTSSNKGNTAKSTTSTITFNPKVDGYYQICYIQSSEKNYDYGKVYKNGTEILSLKGKEVTSYECKDLGNLSTSDTIKVTYQKDSSGNTGKDEISFYIQTGTYNENFETIDVGYRYEGQNPNNYIWFNNEMWRIIGSIPTKADASGTTTNLVKIIRKDSIGTIAYHPNQKSAQWGDFPIYKLLNYYYYGKKNGTNTSYCYEESTTAKTTCNYKVIGISNSSTDYYGRMVKNVYWNTGSSTNVVTASAIYTAEKTRQTVQGRIGLMSASDYGYAASSANHNSTTLDKYNTADITLSNWLYGQGYEMTNIIIGDSGYAAIHINAVDSSGKVVYKSTANGFDCRPVLYLDENVYVISGSGTEADPYIIGM